MTAVRKIAVVGTSNIGAVKYAASTMAAEFPDLAVTFYGLPGGKFAKARVDGQGHFQPPKQDEATRKLAQKVNGTATLDLRGLDAVLVIADALGMVETLFVAAQYDVIDWPTRRDRPLLSGPAFHAAMREAITTRCEALARQFDGIAPLFVAQAPYPSTAVTQAGPHRKDPYAMVADHPELPRLHDMFRAALTRTLAEHGITFVPQPAETMAGPFLTKPAHAKGALDFRAEDRVLDDHRHMNAAFGASLFRAFALALGPSGAEAKADPNRQIKE